MGYHFWDAIPRTPTDTTRIAAYIAEQIAGLATDPGEGHITIFPHSYDSIGQGTWALGVQASQWLYGYFYNTTQANLDNISYKVYLAAGTYSLMLFTLLSETSGIVDIDIDAVEVASWDRYQFVVQWNVRRIQTGIVIATPGLKTLKLRLDGKNPSATAYRLHFGYLSLWRTE